MFDRIWGVFGVVVEVEMKEGVGVSVVDVVVREVRIGNGVKRVGLRGGVGVFVVDVDIMEDRGREEVIGGDMGVVMGNDRVVNDRGRSEGGGLRVREKVIDGVKKIGGMEGLNVGGCGGMKVRV